MSLDILQLWKDNTHRYGDLAAMAYDMLSIAITTGLQSPPLVLGREFLTNT